MKQSLVALFLALVFIYSTAGSTLAVSTPDKDTLNNAVCEKLQDAIEDNLSGLPTQIDEHTKKIEEVKDALNSPEMKARLKKANVNLHDLFSDLDDLSGELNSLPTNIEHTIKSDSDC